MRIARSSLRGSTVGTPFLLRILCLLCCYATTFKYNFLLRYLCKYDFNPVTKFMLNFNIINLASVLAHLNRKCKKFKVENDFVTA